MSKERRSLHEIFESLSEIVTKKDDIEARLGRALKRERSGSTKRDGWPTSNGNDGSNSSGGKSKLSSVERAVMLRPQRDRHRELTLDAIGALGVLNASAKKVISLLDSLDDLLIVEPTAKVCECCEGKRGANGDRAVAHRGTVGDRLSYVMDLCDACYSFVVQSAKPGSRKGKIPTDSQISDHERRGRWRVRTTSMRGN